MPLLKRRHIVYLVSALGSTSKNKVRVKIQILCYLTEKTLHLGPSIRDISQLPDLSIEISIPLKIIIKSISINNNVINLVITN